MKKRNELKVNNDYYLQNEIIEIDNYCDKKGILDNQKKRMATLAAYLMKHNENEMERYYNVEALKTYFSVIVND